MTLVTHAKTAEIPDIDLGIVVRLGALILDRVMIRWSKNPHVLGCEWGFFLFFFWFLKRCNTLSLGSAINASGF